MLLAVISSPLIHHSVQEVGVSKPTFFDLLPFKMAKMLVGFCKSLPERYEALMEYWRERSKEKIEEDEEDDDGDAETEGLFRFVVKDVC